LANRLGYFSLTRTSRESLYLFYLARSGVAGFTDTHAVPDGCLDSGSSPAEVPQVATRHLHEGSRECARPRYGFGSAVNIPRPDIDPVDRSMNVNA
jgi:hypothetical protein